MHDPNQHTSGQLLAQNGTGHGGTETPGQGQTPDEHHQTDAGQTHQQAGHDQEKGSLFDKVFAGLGDHHEFELGPEWVQFPYPVILVDDGLHVYASVEKMQEAGQYVLNHTTHHIERAADHKPPALDMSVTGVVFFQWVAIAVLLGLLIPMARSAKKRGDKPFSGIFNAIEALIEYVRDQIVIPNIGHKHAYVMLPIFLTFFFFILTMNIVGLLPGGHSATGNVNVTGGLAICAFFVMQLSGIFKNGIVHWLKHLTGGTPWPLWIIMIPIEFIGLFTKPFSLCIRLFANMTAGHIIMLSLTGLALMASAFIPVTWGFSLFINCLELLVVFLQAYVFTTLTAVFTGMGMESHDHAEAH